MPLSALLLAACSPSTQTVGIPTESFAHKTTAEQGIRDAEYDLSENEFHIFRYDMPNFRFGAWSEYEANYKEFGINEHITVFTSISLAYCKAYNAVMDQALERKFGNIYIQKRDKILPPKGAKKFDHKAQTRESKALRELPVLLK